ncbi:PAS domain S-box protein, partial [Pseudoxanthomonas sp. SGD-10]
DYTYNPLFDTEGNVEYIVATIIDVTKNVESRNLLNHQKEELQKLNNELSAINGEFAAANEELIALNENLAEAQRHLELSLQQLSESEYLFRSIFEQSKMALCLLRGRELVTQLANDKILEIWGRKREEVIGRPQEEARPELKGQFILDALKRAYDTGEVYFNNEYKANVYCKGKLRTGYFNSVYQPLKNDRGQVTGLLVILEEVTDRVLQKLKSERIQEEFQQAVSTAALGTWSIDASTYMLQLSDRAKELFRLPSGYDPRPDSILNVVDPAFRQQVSNAIRRCLKRHEPFDLDFQVTGVFKEQRKWVRGTGRMFLKANGEPDYLAGILMDITERKEDETRKNDFI